MLLDADFVEQLRETRLGTQWIGHWVYAKVSQIVVAFLIGALKPVESFGLFAEAQLNGGKID